MTRVVDRSDICRPIVLEWLVVHDLITRIEQTNIVDFWLNIAILSLVAVATQSNNPQGVSSSFAGL